MTSRRAMLVFAAVAMLLVAVNAVLYSLYRAEVGAVTRTLDDRLMALGTTAARWLGTSGDGDREAVLSALVAENQLEDAYVLDARLQVVAGVRTRPNTALNLLRVDQDRVAAALDGKRSVGRAFSVEQVEVDGGYFPFERGHAAYVLALEAGAEYHAPATRLRTTYLAAVALIALIAVVFGVALGLALRSLELARIAYGRAERLAAIGQTAAMVAHEVRNPLGILRGQVELVREKLGDLAPPRERARFDDMLAEIERLNRLTEEFLGLARDAPLELVPVDVPALVTEIAAAARVASPDQAANVTLALGASALTVDADPQKLRQAIYNLVVNALQIGGPSVKVSIEVARESARRGRITIADDGPGVPEDLADRLFEPFVTARPSGNGLGLAIARRIVERHRGTLVLERGGARGARFSMYLPLPEQTS